jgi:hypothetical protein
LSALPFFPVLFGGDLNASDFQRLEARWIRPEDAQVAGLRRVNSIDGREMFGRKSGNLAGIILPTLSLEINTFGNTASGLTNRNSNTR